MTLTFHNTIQQYNEREQVLLITSLMLEDDCLLQVTGHLAGVFHYILARGGDIKCGLEFLKNSGVSDEKLPEQLLLIQEAYQVCESFFCAKIPQVRTLGLGPQQSLIELKILSTDHQSEVHATNDESWYQYNKIYLS